MTAAGAADSRLFRSLVEQTPDAVVFADRDGIIRIWNAASQTLLGFSADEAIGQSLDLIVPERFRRAHWEATPHGQGRPSPSTVTCSPRKSRNRRTAGSWPRREGKTAWITPDAGDHSGSTRSSSPASSWRATM